MKFTAPGLAGCARRVSAVSAAGRRCTATPLPPAGTAARVGRPP